MTGIFQNVKVICDDGVYDRVVAVRDGKICGVHKTLDSVDGAWCIDGKGLYLSPGFVDVHVHGGGGYGVMSCKPEEITKMCAAHAKYGTTSILPTTLASPPALLGKAIAAVRAAAEQCDESNILGIHLEGPFLSKEMTGAQSKADLMHPDAYAYSSLLDAWDGIRMMGAAPELPGGMKLGEELAKRGIVASVAHSNADYDTTIQAAHHGYTDITHIYSACSSVHKVGAFRVAGVVEAGLVDDRYSAQTIADLRHLPHGLLRLIYKCKGPEKMVLVTDGLEFSAMDLEEGVICTQGNGVKVIFEDGVMKLADRSKLAGSVATSSRLVKNMYQTVGVPLWNAVKMASHTPAALIGFGNTKGRIAAGYDSDLILLNENIEVQFCMVSEKIVLNTLQRQEAKT